MGFGDLRDLNLGDFCDLLWDYCFVLSGFLLGCFGLCLLFAFLSCIFVYFMSVGWVYGILGVTCLWVDSCLSCLILL